MLISKYNYSLIFTLIVKIAFISCVTYDVNLSECGIRRNGRDLKIVNGVSTAPGDWPWQV